MAPGDPPLNWNEMGLCISSLFTGTPPMSGSWFCSRIGIEPLLVMSMPPVTATAPFCTSSWAQACDFSTENVVMHGSNWMGRPSTPPSSVLINSTAASAARRSSGNEPERGVLLVDHADDDRVVRAGGLRPRSGSVPNEVSTPGNWLTTVGPSAALAGLGGSRGGGRRLLHDLGLLDAPGGGQHGRSPGPRPASTRVAPSCVRIDPPAVPSAAPRSGRTGG